MAGWCMNKKIQQLRWKKYLEKLYRGSNIAADELETYEEMDDENISEIAILTVSEEKLMAVLKKMEDVVWSDLICKN